VQYEVTEEQRARIDNTFTYHPPGGDQIPRYVSVRHMGRLLAIELCQLCPPSRELSLALTNLEQAVFWANAAIARNEPQTPAPRNEAI
jgi:hypothetical protein